MADKKLRRLSRRELIEIIYEVRKREAALEEENEALKQQLADRRLKFSKAGDLAELSASVNGLFEAAQATAAQYLLSLRAAAEEMQTAETDAEPTPDQSEPSEPGEGGDGSESC